MTPAQVQQHSCIVEASAGTGKTRELVHRIADAVQSGVPVEAIVAVTFTYAAAGEMKLRLRDVLGTRLDKASGTEREHLERAVLHLEKAFIGTIHAFCARLLRERPVEARVDPAFEELPQPEAERVFARVFRRWIERKLEQPTPALRRCLARLAWREEWQRLEPLDALRGAAWNIVEWRDHPTPWSQRPFDREAAADSVLESAHALAVMLNERERRFDDFTPLCDVVDRALRGDKIRGARDYDQLEADLIRLPGLCRFLKRGRYRSEVLTAWDALLKQIEDFRRSTGATLAVELRDEFQELVGFYQEEKRRAGQLDFMDLLISARDLLKQEEPRTYFQRRFQRLFVDEFQDTDPLQAEILMQLCDDGAAQLFLVGDPKQSIYRFRRADVRLYNSINGDLENRGVPKQRLQSSRRSVDEIQTFVNASFEGNMPDYLPLTGGRPAPAGQPSIIALPMPRPYGGPNITKKAINLCAPDTVAAFIEWVVKESGWTITDPGDDSRRIPIGAEHVCILFRRFTNAGVDLTQEYVRGLEARGLDHVLVGSKSFHKREEVGALRTALRAIEWPDDELSVFATIRGNLFAVDDGTLLKFRHTHRHLRPLAELPEDLDLEFEPIRSALKILGQLHRGRNHRPIADTVNELLEYTRAHAGFAFRKSGERVIANVYRFNDLARRFEATGATSFRAFIDFLEEEADTGETGEAPILEQDAAGVKLMTVHRAKGLEFPVVILADLTANLAAVEGSDRYVDNRRGLCAQKVLGCAPWDLLDHREDEDREDRAEAERITYVGVTRARDVLVLCAVGAREFEASWLSPLHRALYPPMNMRRFSDKAPGCPPFGELTVLDGPLEAAADDCIRPGLHTPRAGGHRVVWFDPSILRLNVKPSAGLDHEEKLTGAPDQLAVYRQWRERRENIVAQSSVPTYNLVRASEAADVDAPGIRVEIVPVGPAMTRPRGRAFGKLVHALLASAELNATRDQLLKDATLEARLAGAAEHEILPAVDLVLRALQNPILHGAAACLRVHREWPIMMRLEDGRLLEGVVDLAYFDGQTWTVVDFKTGSGDQLRHRRQIGAYALALQRIASAPVRAVLLEL